MSAVKHQHYSRNRHYSAHRHHSSLPYRAYSKPCHRHYSGQPAPLNRRCRGTSTIVLQIFIILFRRRQTLWNPFELPEASGNQQRATVTTIRGCLRVMTRPADISRVELSRVRKYSKSHPLGRVGSKHQEATTRDGRVIIHEQNCCRTILYVIYYKK